MPARKKPGRTNASPSGGPGSDTPFGTFFLPGPTEVRPEILQAMAAPVVSHRGESFTARYRRAAEGLQQIFRTHRPVYLITGSATAAMEMAVRGAPEGPILSLVNGAFADRFARIAQRCGRRTRVVKVPWGQTLPLAMVERNLAIEQFSAVTLTHSETSTGALTDIRAVTELAHRYGAMTLVDSVTGIGGMPVETADWEVDFIFTGSQKAMALPPGMAFAVASEAYILQAQAVPDRGYYLDPVEFEESSLRDGTPTTPAINLMYAVDAQVQHILKETLDARWARHAAMQQHVEDWVQAQHQRGLAVDFLAKAGERSATVSCLTLPPAMDSADVVRAVEERGFVIGRGYGELKASCIRIGHMGDHRPEGLERCLAAVSEALEHLR